MRFCARLYAEIELFVKGKQSASHLQDAGLNTKYRRQFNYASKENEMETISNNTVAAVADQSTKKAFVVATVRKIYRWYKVEAQDEEEAMDAVDNYLSGKPTQPQPILIQEDDFDDEEVEQAEEE